ncbi:unnamed protein product, partial [Ectocarpus fasciculatus]
YILQGISGTYIKYDLRSESYVIDPSLELVGPVRDLVLSMCEIGWLYNRVAKYITKVEKTAINGLVSQSFGYSIQEELHDYYRLLAVLEQELGRSEGGDGQVAMGRASQRESARRILNGNRFDFCLMCLMARLVDGALPLQGGALASRLHGYATSGDASSSAIVRRMLVSVCQPLYAIMIRWIMHGELIDTYKEFFIGVNPDVSANGGSLWHDLYFIRSTMLPNFFSKDLAQKILVIGKSFNFLRACIHSEMRHMEATLRTLQYGDETKLEEIVGRVALLTDERLLKVMMDKAHLVTHLHALKSFMLLGQGDFVTCLMDSVSPELKKRASQIYRHNLTGILEGALRSCNAQYEPAYVLDKITVRLLEPSPGDTGWEIFSLDYAVDAPLTALI